MSPPKRTTEMVDMGKLMSISTADPLVLYQLSGPGRPRRVRVLPLEEIAIGRDEDCRVVLPEEAVSPFHAKIYFPERDPEILDLGGSGGTFLNGKRVERALLKDGDQIQIGASVFQVVIQGTSRERPPAVPESVKEVQSRIRKSRIGSPKSAEPSISGSLSDMRLPSLLQVIESDRVSGTLVLRHAGPEGLEGRLYVVEGAIRHATLGRARGTKALYRLLALEEGSFEFFTPGRTPEYETVTGDLSWHLLEAMRQKDELVAYREQLPGDDARLLYNAEMNLNVAKVPPVVYEVLAAVGQHGTVGAILEQCPLSDFEICRVLLVLLKHQLLLAAS